MRPKSPQDDEDVEHERLKTPLHRVRQAAFAIELRLPGCLHHVRVEGEDEILSPGLSLEPEHALHRA